MRTDLWQDFVLEVAVAGLPAERMIVAGLEREAQPAHCARSDADSCVLPALLIAEPVNLVSIDAPIPTRMPSKPLRAPASASTSRTIRVLLVEDNPVNCELAAQNLLQLGFAVLIAENGLRALQMLDSHRIDVVLMDCDMPVMDGLEATAELRRREALQGASPLPVIAFTAHDSKKSHDECLRAGMNGFLRKPFTREQLCSALASFLPDGGIPAG